MDDIALTKNMAPVLDWVSTHQTFDLFWLRYPFISKIHITPEAARDFKGARCYIDYIQARLPRHDILKDMEIKGSMADAALLDALAEAHNISLDDFGEDDDVTAQKVMSVIQEESYQWLFDMVVDALLTHNSKYDLEIARPSSAHLKNLRTSLIEALSGFLPKE